VAQDQKAIAAFIKKPLLGECSEEVLGGKVKNDYEAEF
jgi:hypothetical protein